MALASCAVALVLLMDVSSSVSDASYAMQRDGTAAALESVEFLRARRSAGDVAVAVVEWASDQYVSVPWAVLKSDADAVRLAGLVRAVSRSGQGGTHMGPAVSKGLRLLDQAPCAPVAEVLDISGDGHSNSMADDPPGPLSGEEMALAGGRHGASMRQARAEAEARGVRINGLPIVTPDEPDVADWYRDNVPTNGGFVLEAAGMGSFAEAIRRKLVMEIAGVERPKG